MAGRFPHEFSGGQRQRIGIARALACDPALIICDEPISRPGRLHPGPGDQPAQRAAGASSTDLTYIFIAHDLAVVKHVSDRIAVMYLGHIVETGPGRARSASSPLHPYTKALLSAVPVPDPVVEETRERIILTGEVPSPLNPPPGCTFHTRCSWPSRSAARPCRSCGRSAGPLRGLPAV